MTEEALAERDGVEGKLIIIEQLSRALEIIRQYNPARIATLGFGQRRPVLRAR
jgi:arginase